MFSELKMKQKHLKTSTGIDYLLRMLLAGNLFELFDDEEAKNKAKESKGSKIN